MDTKGNGKPLLGPEDSDFVSTLERIKDDESASDVISDDSWGDWEEVELSVNVDVKLEPGEPSFETEGHKCNDNKDSRSMLVGKSQNNTPREKKRGFKHPGRQYVCKLCNNVFASKMGFSHHIKMHDDFERTDFECKLCKKMFRDRSTLKLHINNEHPANIESKRTCRICDKIFADKEYLKIHENIHAGIRFPCHRCDKTFSARSTLKCHLKLHEGDTKTMLRCRFCKKGFSNKYNLKMHEKNHTGHQDYVCDTCDAKFSRISDLESHVTIHTGEKPYKCDICNASYRVSGDLGRHRRKHKETSERKKLSCRYCNKVYASPNELKQHETKHEEEMGLPITHAQFTCGICRKILSNQFTYEAHLLFHKRQDESGGNREANNSKCTSKKLDCELCEKTFSNTSNKLKHMRSKHSDTSFKCESCHKMFQDIKYLKRHMKVTHMGQFSCSQCERLFRRRNILHRHELKAHTIAHAQCSDDSQTA